MIAFYWYVLCIGILMSWHANDVMFFGCQANFGTQKNYATGTQGHKSCWYSTPCATDKSRTLCPEASNLVGR